MAVLILTQNPKKIKEYKEHFSLYGIKKSIHISEEMNEEAIKEWLTSQPKKSFVIREEADIYDASNMTPIARPYRISKNNEKSVVNISNANVYTLDNTQNLIKTKYTESIKGYLKIQDKDALSFDWDDVFIPHNSQNNYHKNQFYSGKLSARNLVLDNIIQEHLAFNSKRAFKYGKLNEANLVDLNWNPLNVKDPIQFDVLPIDMYYKNSSNFVNQFSLPALEQYGIQSLLISSLEEGAHFRAASSVREWIYWAPGSNAGIPLTPKENEGAELVYLVHDMAHYALPDLIVNTPKNSLNDKIIILHRMLGEVLAMVTADMFFMHAMETSDIDVDSTSHGIYQIFTNSNFEDLKNEDVFFEMYRNAAHALLRGDTTLLKKRLPDTKEIETQLKFFTDKYSKFALADYEWTSLNLNHIHDNQNRVSHWIDTIGHTTLDSLKLTTSQNLINRLPKDQNPGIEFLINVLIDDIVKNNLKPKMDRKDKSPKSRNEVVTLSYKRYIAGQMALYSRYQDYQSENISTLKDALNKDEITQEYGEYLRDIFNADILELSKKQNITALDCILYQSVFPAVKPHFVSYVNPTYESYDSFFKSL